MSYDSEQPRQRDERSEVPIAYPSRRSNPRALVIAALLVILGIVGFLVMRSGSRVPDGAKQSMAEPLPAPDMSRPSAAPSAPTNVASRATAAMPASSNAPRAVPPWKATLQPTVVAAMRNDSLAEYQVQMEHWSCEGEQCVGNLRIPPNVEAGRKGDMSAAANIFNSIKGEMARSDIEVAVRSIHKDGQGLAVSLVFTPDAASQGRFYTYDEIAAIRMESVQQGMKMQRQDPAH